MENKNTELYNKIKFDLINSHDFIETVIDNYLVVKNEVKDRDYIERHDFIQMIIDKLNKK